MTAREGQKPPADYQAAFVADAKAPLAEVSDLIHRTSDCAPTFP